MFRGNFLCVLLSPVAHCCVAGAFVFPLQTEWNEMQMAQLRMTHMQDVGKKERKDKAGSSKKSEVMDDKNRRVVKPISRKAIKEEGAAPAVEEEKAEWDEV